MLSVQPNFSMNTKPAFKGLNDDAKVMDKGDFDDGKDITCKDCFGYDDYKQDIDIFENEDTYIKARKEMEDLDNDFGKLASDKDLKMPKPAKKLLEGGAVVTGGILGGMATGWGTKKSIAGFKALNKTKAVVGMKSKMVAAWGTAKKFIGKVLNKFTNSRIYTTPKAKLNEWGTKFANSKIGKPIAKAYDAVKGFVGKAYGKVKNAVNWALGKIKGVKKETYEKAVVNTVGVSGGIASGVTTLKEQSEKDAK